MSSKNLSNEIASFNGLWEGGYYEGNPLDSLSKSSFGAYGYVSVLHAIYLGCIKPYVNSETIALEIGPGRGAWTKALLPSKQVWVLDALSAEYNKFFEYLNHPKNVEYFQVNDFKCEELPENYFNYMFSFGCLCHVSTEGIDAYAKNLFSKLKPGANCFWMLADKKKYQKFRENSEKYNIWRHLSPKRKNLALVKWFFNIISDQTEAAFIKEDDFADKKGHWHDADLERTCAVLRNIGYKIVDPDVDIVARDPIIHFVKP